MSYKSEVNTESSAKRVKIEVESDCKSEFAVDENGLIAFNPGQMIGNYKLEEQLGQGGFGRVVKATNMECGDTVAIKLINTGEIINHIVAMAEVKALEAIRNKDPDNKSLCVKMLEWNMCANYTYIVFPLLGASLTDFMLDDYEDPEPYPMEQVRHISYQLCQAVNFLHENGMTHTDLKPDNIVFVDSDFITIYDEQKNCNIRRVIKTDVRLIDFAFLTKEREFHKPIVSARSYRAPEVVLRLGWSHPCDVWSIGCSLIEIYNGNLLFDADADGEHLAMMQRTLGPVPLAMTNQTKTTYFNNGRLDREAEKESVKQCRPLQEHKLQNFNDDELLLDLVAKMLQYEPAKRIRLSEALLHPFFNS